MTQILDVYCVYETVDEQGRRGRFVAVCSTKENADIISKGKGWYGGPGDVVKQKAVKHKDGTVHILQVGAEYKYKLDDEQSIKTNHLREKALSKLTNEEKQILGL